jgi:hypothetical protein
MRHGFVGEQTEKTLKRRERGGHPQRTQRKAFDREVRKGNAKHAKKGVCSGHNGIDIELRIFIRLARVAEGMNFQRIDGFQAES